MDDASLLDVETLFTVIETDRPTLVTMGIFGKPKLARLFAAVPERQQAPDVLWSGEDAAERDRDPVTRYATTTRRCARCSSGRRRPSPTSRS